MIRIEGSGASQLVELIRRLGYNTDVTIELATVTSEPPDLKIQVDNMNIELEKDDLIVAQSLTNHKRTVNLKSEGKTNIDATVTNMDIGFVFAGQGTLTFTSIKLPSANQTIQEAELEFVDELKKGDRVIVAGINQGQAYIILDRVVIY